MYRFGSMNLSRRQFGKNVTAASLFLANPLSASAETAPDEGWIDAHVHVWTPDTKKYPIDPSFQIADMQPPSFTAEELFSHCRPSGVTRIVLIQMSFYQWDHRYMVDVMRAHPGVFSGVSLIDVHAADLEAEVKRHAELGMRGFRLHSHGDANTWVNDPAMARLWKLAKDNSIAICPLINPQDIRFVDALCKKHPENRVVVDHFARIGVSGAIEQDRLAELCRLARFPNVYVKTSAFYALGKKKAPYRDLIPMIRKVVDAFGPERLMWASDCPFQVEGGHTYSESVALIRDQIDFLSDSDRQWILRDTADQVFFKNT